MRGRTLKIPQYHVYDGLISFLCRLYAVPPKTPSESPSQETKLEPRQRKIPALDISKFVMHLWHYTSDIYFAKCMQDASHPGSQRSILCRFFRQQVFPAHRWPTQRFHKIFSNFQVLSLILTRSDSKVFEQQQATLRLYSNWNSSVEAAKAKDRVWDSKAG